MKVLIVGEYSAFAKNLALGINRLADHEAIVFAYEDSFKKINQDGLSYTYYSPTSIKLFGIQVPHTAWIKGFMQFLSFKKTIKKYKDYFDVIFIINGTFIRKQSVFIKALFSLKDLDYVSNKGTKIFLSACGGDPVFYKHAHTDAKLIYGFGGTNTDLPKARLEIENELKKKIVGVIPMSYQYAQAYRIYGQGYNLLPSIHLPFDLSSVKVKKNYDVNRKILLFNGALRPNKGVRFINEAVDRLEKKYSDRIVVSKIRLPYDKYLEYLPEIDLFIDNCIDPDYGMSGISAMAAGCVVFSGNEPGSSEEVGFDSNPVINLKPDVDQIFTSIERFILNPELIEQVGIQSRKHVEKYHECSYIAKLYCDTFQNANK